MSILDWLRSLFRPRPVVRDVTRIAGPGADLDLVREVVDVRGGPLKEGHRRLALRDGRLLPKTKPLGASLGLRKRKRIFTRQDAGRLFSGTMRTRNRGIRDLMTDEVQLARYGLPVWRSEGELAAALELSVSALRFFSIHREADRFRHYVSFAVPKRSGGERVLHAPKRKLKAIQRRLNGLLVEKLPVSEHAHGFRKGRSIRTGAERHVGRAVVVTMDLAEFFPSVTFPRVRGLLISLGYSYPVATTLAVLMTEAERQPVDVDGTVFHAPVGPRTCVQGAPTSPGVTNSVVLRLDRRLSGAARSLGFTYTRYADDLTFSGDDTAKAAAMVAMASRVIRAEGFEVNARKTRVSRRGARQKVTGLVVNQKVAVPREEVRRLRAILHTARKRALAGPGHEPVPHSRSSIRGKIAYLSMVDPGKGEKLLRDFEGIPESAFGADAPRRRSVSPPSPGTTVGVLSSQAAGTATSRPVLDAAGVWTGAPRRFEFVGGTSSKYWIVELDGASQTVRFGRIGTQGQARTKTFGSPEEARRETEKLILEKTGKGYVER